MRDHDLDAHPRAVEMTGPDTRMDERANPLPPKCAHCTMPELDAVANPYLLVRGFAAPAETAPAARMFLAMADTA